MVLSVFTHIPREEEEEEKEEEGGMNELTDAGACPGRGRVVGEDVTGVKEEEDEMSDLGACPGRGRVVGHSEFKGEGRGERMTSRPTPLPARAEGESSDEMSGLEHV